MQPTGKTMMPLAPRKQTMGHSNKSNSNNKRLIRTSYSLSSSSSSESELDQTCHRRRGTASTRDMESSTFNTKNNNYNAKNNSGWRRYGIERRKQLLIQDEEEGGNRFVLNYQCRIQGYFALSEKIIARFNDAFATGSDPEANYVMGNRLIHFLTEALPRHPSYMKKDPLISRLREKSFQSLVQIKKRIEALALRIDEEQLNKYIMHDFDPFADDDDDDSSTSSWSESGPVSSSIDSAGGSPPNDPQWESFDGWSFDLPDKLTQKSSSGDVNFARDVSLLLSTEVNDSAETEDTSNETFSSSETSFQAGDDFEPIYDSFGLEFLRRIASEDVRYETDSEAADSWAQECESELENTTVYSTTSVSNTYDPARIALKELLTNKRQRPTQRSTSKTASNQSSTDDKTQFNDNSKENQSLSFDLSPDNSFDSADDEEEEIWMPFDSTNKLSNSSGMPPERVSL